MWAGVQQPLYQSSNSATKWRRSNTTLHCVRPTYHPHQGCSTFHILKTAHFEDLQKSVSNSWGDILFNCLSRILLCLNRFLIDHVATKLAQFCHIFLGQSVFLIGPHNAASLGCWPGSRVWTNQKEFVKKSFPS